MNRQGILGLLALLILVSILLLFAAKRPLHSVDAANRLQTYLTKRLESDSLAIARFVGSSFDSRILTALDDSPFYIDIISGDSSLYWNDRTTSDRVTTAGLMQITELTYGNTRAHVWLNLTSIPTHPEITKRVPGLNELKAAGATNSKESIGLRGHILSLKFMEEGHGQSARVIAWWLIFIATSWFASMIATGRLSIPGMSSESEYKTLGPLAITLLFRMVNGFPAFKSLFSNTWLTRPFGDGMPVVNDMSDLLAGILVFGFVVWWMQGKGRLTPAGIRHAPLLAFAAGLFTFLSFSFSLQLMEHLVMVPFVNLEIESLLQFDAISFLLMITFVVLMLLIFHGSQVLFTLLEDRDQSPEMKYLWISAGWVCGAAVLYLFGWLRVPLWILAVFVVAYSLILDAYCEKQEKRITYLIWWLMMFSAFLAVALFYFGLRKNVSARTSFIHEYYHEPDDVTVQRMQQLSDSLVAGDVFSRIASLDVLSRLDNNDLHQYIFGTDSSARSYSIELFDKRTGNTLFNNHFADFHKLNQTYSNSRVVARNLVHNPFENTYLLRFEIARSVPANTSWYLFIIRQEPSHPSSRTMSVRQDFGYAVFSEGNLIEKKDGLQQSPDPATVQSVTTNIIVDGYSFVVSQPSDQYRIVSWKKVSGLIKPISLFSFVFALSGLLILILTLLNTRYNFLPDNLPMRFGSRSSLKTKIQLAIILLIIVTFLIIGAITAFYFKNLMEANQKMRQREELESIVNNIRSDLQYMADDESALAYISSKLKDIAYVHNKNLSMYDKNGRFAGSTSREQIQLRIPYHIWQANMSTGPQSVMSTSGGIGRDFVPLFLGSIRPFAFLAVDHQEYNSSANILDFLSTILNAYIFLFLIAGAIAITIANSITQPLSILADKLKKFKLGKSNELLQWKSNDEIGTLITDYNNLTQELERSAGLLAKTERDMAWREMAKQVAHEIKNPLTPMKLSIQYLEKAAREQPERAGDMIPRISSTLIEQIDNLSQIASEFSNFAAMPQATNEKVVLNEIVETIHDLFRKREDMDISMIEPIDELYVFADKNHLVRILNNLLKNAIQAIPDNRRGKIEIELSRQSNDAVIRVSDNGTGIPDHMKDKVFTPNFTTKSSGTGLGLAISANMIESFNGRIYFNTRPGTGTDFYVSIPLMRLDEYLNDDTRVTLED